VLEREETERSKEERGITKGKEKENIENGKKRK
jgi:hypothetical protein